MNHTDVRELLELASGGLDRIAAGDTVEAAAVAGHLAGCPACLEELERLSRVSGVIREFVVEETQAEEPPVVLPPELRERTLALVREVGVARPNAARAIASSQVPVAPGQVAAAEVVVGPAPAGPVPVVGPAPAVGSAPAGPAPVVGSTPAGSMPRPQRLRPGRRAAWLASIAAAVVLSVVATNVLVGNGGGGGDKTGLAAVVKWSSDMAGAPGARRIVLTAATTGEVQGDLSLVPSSGSLIVVVPALGAPPSGREYRCWLETATGRTWVGKMAVDEGISYWVGTVPSLAAAPAGSTFGISLEDAAGSRIDGPAVLHGTL